MDAHLTCIMPDINTLQKIQTRPTRLDRRDIEAYLFGSTREQKAPDDEMKPPESLIMSGVRWNVTYTQAERPSANGAK